MTSIDEYKNNDLEKIKYNLEYETCITIFINTCLYSSLDTIKYVCEYIKSIIDDYIKNELEQDNKKNNIFYNRFDYRTIDETTHLNIIKYLIEFYESINCDIYIREDIVGTACSRGNYNIVKYLLEYPRNKFSTFNINILNNSIFTKSCNSGNVELIKYLLDKYEIFKYFNYEYLIIDNINNINVFKILFDYAFKNNSLNSIVESCLIYDILLKCENINSIIYLIDKYNFDELILKYLLNKHRNILDRIKFEKKTFKTIKTNEITELLRIYPFYYQIINYILTDIKKLETYLDIAILNGIEDVKGVIRIKQFKIKIAKKIILKFIRNYVFPIIYHPNGRIAQRIIKELNNNYKN